jgi:hypothetical protein
MGDDMGTPSVSDDGFGASKSLDDVSNEKSLRFGRDVVDEGVRTAFRIRLHRFAAFS